MMEKKSRILIFFVSELARAARYEWMVYRVIETIEARER